MSYKLTKDDEAYWLQIHGKKSALIRLANYHRLGIVLDAVRKAYEDQEATKPAPVQAQEVPSQSAEEFITYINHCKTVDSLRAIIESRDAAQRQAGREEADDKAFRMLETFGVPRGRAETVVNGIMVLQDRMRKAIESEQMASASQSKRYAALEEAAKLAKGTIEYVKQYVEGQGLSAEEDCDEAVEAIDKALADLEQARKG